MRIDYANSNPYRPIREAGLFLAFLCLGFSFLDSGSVSRPSACRLLMKIGAQAFHDIRANVLAQLYDNRSQVLRTPC